MEIEFRGSPGPSLGVEVELNIVDRNTGALDCCASQVIPKLAGSASDGSHPKVKPELFDSMLEAITGVCQTVGDARDDLAETFAEIATVLRPLGLGVCCSGTHPFGHWADLQLSPKDRYHELVDRIQWPARRLAINGIHYHVGVPDAEAAIAITNALAAELPVFVALSASSPYWHGHDTGMASCRTKVFEGLPTAGLPPQLDSWADFERFMRTLVHAGAIETIREVWWDVRPHPDFGTVELRMCDGMASLHEIMAGAALAQSLVADLTDRWHAGEPLRRAAEWTVKENKWLAARHGVEAQLIVDDDGNRRPVRDVLDDLIDRLQPVARRLGCEPELLDAREIVATGPGYVRQRAVRAAHDSQAAVALHLVAEFDAGVPLDVS